MDLMNVKIFFVGITIVLYVVNSAPVHPNDIDSDHENKGNTTEQDLGLHYEKYLQEVIRVLEEDEEFKVKLEHAKKEDIISGKISEDLQFVNHRVRTQLDELKRVELDRLRRTLKEHAELSGGGDGKGSFRGRGSPRKHNLPGHVDAMNPHTFEVEDLKRLVIQTTKDLDEVDRRRREEFKVYEMEKEHQRRASLEKLDKENRKKAVTEYEEQQKKHKDHPKLHHPGSRQQLEEVWEETDQMRVEDFDPRTFHSAHDMNEDGFLDDDELNAIFVKELNKMYDSKNAEDDMQERYEEMNRMREHVKNETDLDHDGMISVDELVAMTKRRDFDQDQGWQGIDEQQQFSEQEFVEYERHRQQQQFQQYPPHPGQVPNHGYPIDTQQFNREDYQHNPQGYEQQPMGYQQPPQGYQHQQAYQHPQPGFQQPPQGYQQHPQGYQQHPQGYQQLPQGYRQPPQGYQQHPQGYQQPPHGYEQPQHGYQQPQHGYEQQSQYGYQQPPQVYQQNNYQPQPPVRSDKNQQPINSAQQQPINPAQRQPINPSLQQPINPSPQQSINPDRQPPVNPAQQQPINPAEQHAPGLAGQSESASNDQGQQKVPSGEQQQQPSSEHLSSDGHREETTAHKPDIQQKQSSETAQKPANQGNVDTHQS